MEHTYDNSQLATYQACPFSYYLQYIVCIKKNVYDDSNASMQFGSAAHSFWQEFYKPTGKKFSELIESYVEPEGMPQFSKQALEFFCKTYNDKYYEKDKQYNVKEVENVSKFNLGKYLFIVKKDGAIETQGNIYGLEHKTTKSLSYNYFEKYFLNSQISAQCYDVIRKYGQCSGILLNVGEIKMLKRKPSGEYDGFMQHPDGFITVKFNRDFINRTQDEIKDWEQNTVAWIEQIEENKQLGDWKKSCGSWGGMICSKCPYKELCKTSVGMKLDESIMDVLYEKCNPFEYLETEEGA